MKIIPTDNPKSCRCDNCLARTATYDVYIGPLYKGTICDDCVGKLRVEAEKAFYVINPGLRLDIPSGVDIQTT